MSAELVKDVLITGVFGFTAGYLVSHLKQTYSDNVSIHGIDRRGKGSIPGVEFHLCDLLDQEGLIRVLELVRPSHVFHLSGSLTNDLHADYLGNVETARNLLSGILQIGKGTCRTLVIGSAAEYGYPETTGQAIPETSQLKPVSPYGLTKVYQTYLAQYFARVHGLWVAIARPFNLIGEGMSTQLFIGHLHSQIQAVRQGKINVIEVGDLSGYRDYVDVRDAVRAYRIILESGTAGQVYNIGSSKLIQIKSVLEMFLNYYGIQEAKVQRQNVNGRSSNDVRLCAETTRIKELGWESTFDIEASVRLFNA